MTLIEKIKNQKCTNKDIALFLGWEYTDTSMSLESGFWTKPCGERYKPGSFHSVPILPNWIGNTDAALSLVPEHYYVLKIGQDGQVWYCHLSTRLNQKDVKHGDERLPVAILLGVLQLLDVPQQPEDLT